jgi:hypothetical protein
MFKFNLTTLYQLVIFLMGQPWAPIWQKGGSLLYADLHPDLRVW